MLFMNNKEGISMCDTEDCGIELRDPSEQTQQTAEMDKDEPIVLKKRFTAYFKHSITEPMDVAKVVLDINIGCEEKDIPMYLILTYGTVVVCRNFDVILRDMEPAKEVFDMLMYLEDQMMSRDQEKPVVEGYQ